MYKDLWTELLAAIGSDAKDFHTIPTNQRTPLWFSAKVDGDCIIVDKSLDHTPSTKLAKPQRLTYKEFTAIYPIYLKRLEGNSVSKEAMAVTFHQVYWYGLFSASLEE